MTAPATSKEKVATDPLVRAVLYVGHEVNEICHLVAQHLGQIDIFYEGKVAGAIAQLRHKTFDVVFVDMRGAADSFRLLVPLVCEANPKAKLVAICAPHEVGRHLASKGVSRVLTGPVREGQFLRVLGIQQVRKHYVDPLAEEERAEHRKRSSTAIKNSKTEWSAFSPLRWLSDAAMRVVSVLYKRTASVLLFTLFVAFVFYGFLIAFFLLSSGWGAPMTLTRGHELVNKVERDLTELKVELSQTTQRVTEARFVKLRAERDFADAKLFVESASQSVEKEIARLNRELRLNANTQGRLVKIKRKLAGQLGNNGYAEDLDVLFKKRLITSKQYNSSVLSLVEASQRLAQIEGELEQITAVRATQNDEIEMLTELKERLASEGPMAKGAGSSGEFMALTQQAFDAKAQENIAREQIQSSDEILREMEDARSVLRRQIQALESTALARAISERIDVVFVPYTGEQRFQQGTALWSCRWTVFWCSKAGSVGLRLPGEVASVHPFFGKPIRGFFVEAKLNDENAASREIIHAARAPFFL